MQMTPRLLTVLKNFSSINPALRFQEGTVLSTVSPQQHVLARADIEQEIPKTFCLYDLNQLLGIVGTMKDADVELNDTFLTVKRGSYKATFFYAEESMIVTPKKSQIDMPSVDVRLTVTDEEVRRVVNGAGILGLPDLVVEADGAGKAMVRATDTSHDSSNVVEVEVDAESEEGGIFNLRVENMKMLPNTYEVELSKKGISHWAHVTEEGSADVEYWIALSTGK